jgi:hypothetical protein
MNDVPSRNRFKDHEGSSHYILGTRGGIQGDPIEMTRFCLTVHQIWSRVLARHEETLGAGYADDAYLMGRIEPTLMALADTVRSFRQDADLEVCLAKCTIYMPGVTKERALHLIRECITTNASGTLGPLLPLLAPDLDIIQVHGLCVVGTPLGPSDYVREYVRDKCGTICKDVETMRICSDPLIRYQLLKFCMNTRLSFLSRNVTPDNMATSASDPAHIGPVHVDQKIVREVLSAASGDTIAKTQSQRMQNWCKYIVQSPHHQGGYAITPTAASGLAAFYSIWLLPSLSRGSHAYPTVAHGCAEVRTSRSTTHGPPPNYKHL